MRVAAVIVIIVALGFGGLTFYLVQNYLAAERVKIFADAEKEKPGIDAVDVVVAQRNLPAGTVLFETDHLRWQPWPDDSLDDDYIVKREDDDDEKIEELEDMVVRSAILAGEPVTFAKVFKREDARFVSGLMSAGMRAVTIGMNKKTLGKAGVILPGDRVDVILTLSVPAVGGRTGEEREMKRSSETIVQNARVMAIDSTFSDLEEGTLSGEAVTLEVTPKQAEVIALAQTMGELTVALRSLTQGPRVVYDVPFTSDLEISQALSGDPRARERHVATPKPGESPARSSEAAPAGEQAAMGETAADTGLTTTRVLALDRDILAGTLIRDSFLTWAYLPRSNAPDDYFVQPRELIATLRGALITRDFPAGELLPRAAVIMPDSPEFIPAAVRPGMRAIGIPIGGDVMTLISASDVIDVLLVGSITSEAGEHRFSETIVQRVRVLLVDESTATAIVEVTQKEAEKLLVARRLGSITLSLHGTTGAGTVRRERLFTSDIEVSQVLKGGVKALLEASEEAPIEKPELIPETAAITLSSVLVAAGDVALGTLLRDSNFRFATIEGPVTADMGYFVKGVVRPATLRGYLVTTAIPADEPLAADKLMAPAEPGFMTTALMDGMRAVSITIDPVTGVSGYVSAGDRIDLVMTYTVVIQGGGERKWSETILQNVRVLAIEQGVDRATGKPTVGDTATVELFPNQVEILRVASDYGVVSMSLRGPPSEVKPEFGYTYASEFGAGAGILEYLGSGRAIGVADKGLVATPPFSRSAIRVLVAERDLAEGTLLRDSDFRFEPVEGELPPGAERIVMGSTAINTLRGALVKSAIAANEFIPAKALFKPNAQGFLAAAIRPGMRAVSIAIDEITGVSGFVSPGDIVDVIMSHEVDDTSEEPILSPRRFAETVARGTRVVAVEQLIDPSSGNPTAGKTVTLEVTPKQAEILALAKDLGALSLALHSASPGATEVAETSFTSDWEISDALLAYSLGAEPMYRVVRPEIPTDPPFDIRWLRIPVFPRDMLKGLQPTLATAAEPAPPAEPEEEKPPGPKVKVYRSVTPSTVEFEQ